ncbi:XdhC/CoxI family protein [Streptomyces triticagri]|uniref:XdhC/CoxI family protein n=1 Tax=Streptomyces triticagri TaxID=2293568 RepID=A0A372M9M7_9ACTN|nr:XdhC/CoxI family protein [Streptomyces triticagri]RFU87215.1 XdhC/CoxI family protein [Streptomyces triticagri]
MRHVIDTAAVWQRSGDRFAMATVLRTWGSSPHPAGASMLVHEDGRVVGSVSGGCVEASVCAVAEEVLAGADAQIETYGVGDEDAFAVGLTCGGTIEVLIREITRATPVAPVAAAVADGRPAALLTDVAGGGSLAVAAGSGPGTHATHGTLGTAELDRAARLAAEGLLSRGASGVVRVGREPSDTGGEAGPYCGPARELLVQCFAAPARLLVFGAAEFARPLVAAGALVGRRVTLCDARAAFATPERFPGAHEVVVDRPERWFAAHEHLVDAATAVCVLTHDARFDVPLLALALRSRAGFVGALGSRRTHQDRLGRLREAGLGPVELGRLRSPIGLDLGGRGPEETAVSILAEIIATARGGSGLPLTRRTGPVHSA